MRLREQHGFTLFELIVVLLILALAVGAVSFSFTQFTRQSSDKLGDEIRHWIEHVKNVSLLSGRPHRIYQKPEGLVATPWLNGSWSDIPTITILPLPAEYRVLVSGNDQPNSLLLSLSDGSVFAKGPLLILSGDRSEGLEINGMAILEEQSALHNVF